MVRIIFLAQSIIPVRIVLRKLLKNSVHQIVILNLNQEGVIREHCLGILMDCLILINGGKYTVVVRKVHSNLRHSKALKNVIVGGTR